MLAHSRYCPSFFDDKFGPGPYMPASRLFWNEFYLDISKIPELEQCPAAQEMVESARIPEQVSTRSLLDLVDYKHQLALKRKVLEELADCFFSGQSSRLTAFNKYVKSQERLEDYARFRAAGEYGHLLVRLAEGDEKRKTEGK